MTLTSLTPLLTDVVTIPRHIALIMDGNRRWARQRGLPEALGHVEGVNALERTVEAAGELGISVLTVFGFSTENWQRNKGEVGALVELVGKTAIRFRDPLQEQGVRLHVIGDLSAFPDHVVENLEATCRATSGGDGLDLVLALNYGGRDDIRRAAKALAQKVAAGELSPDDVSEELLHQHLDTAQWPDPDILVRTSGEQRISNFLLWQTSYSEIMVHDVLWPDFGHKELERVVEEFQRRERRRGN